MTDEDNEYQVQEPGLLVFFIAFLLASVVSFIIATYLLELSPAWLALLAGGICGILGFCMGENIGDAIMFSLILALLVTFFIKAGPDIEMLRTGIVPVATGFCLGNLVCGIWKEIS